MNVLVDPVGFLTLNQMPVPLHWVENTTFLPPLSLPVDPTLSFLTTNATFLPPPRLPVDPTLSFLANLTVDPSASPSGSSTNITWREEAGIF
jgi:hypothetical protein